jgi:hypothetical protein
MASEATSRRVQLQRGGYCPIPLIGKRPAQQAWQKKSDTNPVEIELWERSYPDAVNTGILTALNPTIDIDILDETAAEAIEALARELFEEGGHFLVRVGKWPKRAILLRTDVPFTKMVRNVVAPNGSVEKIEVLGDGQQVVVHGIHPDTKKPYLWHGGEPGKIKYEDLPYVRADELVAFLDKAVALLVRDFGYQAAAERPRATNGARSHSAHGPQDWGCLMRNIVNLSELHDSARDLAAKYVTAGLGAGAAVNALRGLFECAMMPPDAARQREFEERYADIPRAVDSAMRKYGRAGAPPDEPTEAVELPEVSYPWQWGEETERDWLVRRLFVRVGLTFLGGAPGTGKSTTGVDVAASLITGMQCIGREVAPC